MFWHTDEGLFGVRNTILNGSRSFDKTIEAFQDGKISREELRLLEDSLDHLYVPITLQLMNTS